MTGNLEIKTTKSYVISEGRDYGQVSSFLLQPNYILDEQHFFFNAYYTKDTPLRIPGTALALQE